jgi:AcrR family transcriptional regulator
MPEEPPRRRRSRGEPRRLLLDAAVELFNERGYDATTREIADRADVSETLLFRTFVNKAGLFREAMIAPFIEFVDKFVAAHGGGLAPTDDPYQVTVAFIGGLYDIFVTHQGLVAALWSATTHEGSDLAEANLLDEVWAAFDKLVQLGKQSSAGRPARNEIATRAIVSMVAGMAVARRSFKTGRLPKRAVVVEEMAKISLYGRMRDDEAD